MTQRPGSDKIETYLVRVLHVLVTGRSFPRGAVKLQSSQTAGSARLKRLREHARAAAGVLGMHGLRQPRKARA
jgi:hypothetical protein